MQILEQTTNWCFTRDACGTIELMHKKTGWTKRIEGGKAHGYFAACWLKLYTNRLEEAKSPLSPYYYLPHDATLAFLFNAAAPQTMKVLP